MKILIIICLFILGGCIGTDRQSIVVDIEACTSCEGKGYWRVSYSGNIQILTQIKYEIGDTLKLTK